MAEMAERLAPTEAGARGMVSALSAISAGMIILRRGFLVPAEMAEMAERLTP